MKRVIVRTHISSFSCIFFPLWYSIAYINLNKILLFSKHNGGSTFRLSSFVHLSFIFQYDISFCPFVHKCNFTTKREKKLMLNCVLNAVRLCWQTNWLFPSILNAQFSSYACIISALSHLELQPWIPEKTRWSNLWQSWSGNIQPMCECSGVKDGGGKWECLSYP